MSTVINTVSELLHMLQSVGLVSVDPWPIVLLFEQT